MLFRPRDLERIAAGEITLAFRRWERPRVKPGSTQRTPIGVIAFDSVDVVEEITPEQARAAGFETPEQVEAAMPPRGPIHRVALRLLGPDPRVALRETPPDETLYARLDRMGPWTYEYLRLIAANPGVRAADLAESVGRERLDFKRNVRKLKELGLTESLNPGYRLSPRGEAVLKGDSPPLALL
ncbi:MAG TPA: hypothetical protein VFZ00_29140 [Solirubrobacter sp.]|nr:hypothetical protein [Solirubrobacter sp.]